MWGRSGRWSTVVVVAVAGAAGAIVFRRWRVLVAAASLAGLVVTLWAWGASFRATHFVGRRVLGTSNPPLVERTARGVTSARGGLTFGAAHDVWDSSIRRTVPGDDHSEWWWTREPAAERVDDGIAVEDGLGFGRFGWTRRSRASGTALGAQWETSLTVPHWVVALALAVAPLAWLSGAWRDRRRYPKGHCRRCGYDLRATPGRCPELWGGSVVMRWAPFAGAGDRGGDVSFARGRSAQRNLRRQRSFH